MKALKLALLSLFICTTVSANISPTEKDALIAQIRTLEANIFIRKKFDSNLYKHVGLWERDTLREALLHNVPISADGTLDEESLNAIVGERLNSFLQQARQRSGAAAQASRLPAAQVTLAEQRQRVLDRRQAIQSRRA